MAQEPPSQGRLQSEKPGCPRWLVASPPTHTDSPGCGTSWLFFFKARDTEFKHWNPPSLAAHLSQAKGRVLSERTASCLLPGRGAERVTQQRLSLFWLPESLSLRFASLPEVSPYSHPNWNPSQRSSQPVLCLLGEGPKASLDSVLLRRAWSRLGLWVKARDSEAPGLPGGLTRP